MNFLNTNPRIASTNIYQLKKKTNFLLVQKGFFLSFEHLKKSKQILRNAWWKKIRRFEYENS